jgi:hypothetical protein
MARKRSYTNEQFIEAVAKSRSWYQVLGHLGLKVGGGTQEVMKKLAKELDLDVSHMQGMAWRKGTKIPVTPARPLEDYLNNKAPIQSAKLKVKLWQAGLKEKRCELCEITEWLGQPAPLQLDHIDGNRNNNELLNLRILCPNCHALTDNYCGKNIGTYD